MFRKDMAAKEYKVLKPFVFRGVQYTPSDDPEKGIFDPVKAQCIPSKLAILIRQRILGDAGPSLAEALKTTQQTAPVVEQPEEADSEQNSGEEDPQPSRRNRKRRS